MPCHARSRRFLPGSSLLAWLVAALVAASHTVAPPAARADERPGAFVEMEVAELLSAGQRASNVVVLKTRKGRSRYLPIWIGESEALAIALRVSRQQPPRPLTHDLLERVMRSLNGKLSRVHIEAVKQSVFLGRIYLKQGARTISLDARPSDAIALAVGAGAPIFAARAVLDQAGVSRDDLRRRHSTEENADDDTPAGEPASRRGSSL